MLFVGDDWAKDHHDVELQDATGKRLTRARLPEGITGIARLHQLIAEHLPDDEPQQVVIGIETDRGPWVAALTAAGYQVYAINPLQAARYRERYGTSGAPRATPATRVCLPTSCEPIVTVTGRCPATAPRSTASRSSPVRTRP